VLLSNDVDSAFEDMSPAMQAVNRSYFLEDAKAKEIAEDRGVSEATVRADPEGSEAPARKPRRLDIAATDAFVTIHDHPPAATN
jgi:hypothetical protein